MNKTCSKEKSKKKKSGYQPKTRKNKTEDLDKPEILFYDGIPYVMVGWPGYESVYALDEKGRYDYALTGWLRKKMDENDNENDNENNQNTENTI